MSTSRANTAGMLVTVAELTALDTESMRLRNEAEALWAVYANTCHTGGTSEQRQWACARATQAEVRAASAENALKAKLAQSDKKAA